MANRNWASGGKVYSMHVSPVIIDTAINIGAAGAVSSVTGPIVSTVTHMSTGVYKITLTDNFMGVLSAHGSMRSPAAGLSGILAIEVQNAPTASITPLTAPSITVKTLDAAGALADPANGSAINVTLLLSNSSVRVQGEQ
jgi:hypothetical protein